MQIPSCCTTSWDDGHPLDQRVAELLTKYGLTGTFYVPIENTRPVLTGSQIRQLNGTFEVGAHTTHHVVLNEVADETAEAEIRESKRRLQDITGMDCKGFCFPKGRFHRNHLEMLRRSGFQFARSVELLSICRPVRRMGMFVIPTTVQAMPRPWSTYVKNGAKRFATRNLLNSLLHSRSGDWTETARAMMRVVARRGGVFHLWGHSWEVEELCQWRQLECMFRGMRDMRSAMPCVPNSFLIQPELTGSNEALPLRCD